MPSIASALIILAIAIAIGGSTLTMPLAGPAAVFAPGMFLALCVLVVAFLAVGGR